MCGIVGFTGTKKAAPVLLNGLAKLEYRGYDSSGIAVRDGENNPIVIKAKGKLEALVEKTNGGETVVGSCGIGHTRWATHGEPSETNAHPHVTADMNVVGVHNGIIENFQELKDKLIRKGYDFYSDTDTEVAIKTIDYYYKKYKVGPIDALAKTMVRVRGSYALAVMFKDYPGQIFVARKESPMIIGVEDDSAYIASDVPAIMNYTRNIYYIDNLEMACVKPGEVVFYNLDGDVVPKEKKVAEWNVEAAEKGGYEHFMMKEIHEQPRVVADTIRRGLGGTVDSITDEGMGITDEDLKKASLLYVVACGSAYHVGMAAQYVLEDIANISTRVELASEFRYRKLPLDKNAIMVVISQSGETADTLAALRKAKEAGIRTLAIVNVEGSSIAREADSVFLTQAGPEIAVATTKAYTAQLIAMYMLAIKAGVARGVISGEEGARYVEEIKSIPTKIEKTIDDKERLQWFASKFSNITDAFFIGRGLDYAVCMEGSLKMKEISYVHTEAYAAGELKHGTISLIEENTLVIGVLTQAELIEKTISNMKEVKSRGAYLVGVTSYGNYVVEDSTDFTIYVPAIDEHFVASLAVVPLQLLGYYFAVARGLDVDKPRNLAKSVTVE